jgi:hypothetical protein
MVVTNNNGFWIGRLDLLTPSFTVALNHNQFAITHNTSSAQFLSDLFWSQRRLISRATVFCCRLLASVCYCDKLGSELLYE